MVAVSPPANGSVGARVLDRMFEPTRQEFFKTVQFTEPAGDPGWFGPDSAVWYVYSHLPTVQIAMAAAAMMETLHPTQAWMAYEHTRAIERDANGVPTGNIDDEAIVSRGGHTLSFFYGTAMGPTAVAEKVSKTVYGIHDHIHGTRPDGVAYRANDPDLLCWNYCTQAWALAESHRRFHPKPLKGAELDRFFAEYARMAIEIGSAPPPTTKAGVDKYLADSVPQLGVTMPTVELLNPLAPWRYPLYQRPLYSVIFWAVQDMHPKWAQKLMNTPKLTPLGRVARRAALKAMLNSAGPDPAILEVRQARARAAATQSATAESQGLHA